MYWLLVAGLIGQAFASPSRLPVQLETRSALDSGLANIHLSFDRIIDEAISLTYGSCTSSHPRDFHHHVGRSVGSTMDRIVWIIPEDVESGGCISAWTDSEVLVGRSEPKNVAMKKRGLRKRASSNSIPMTNASGIDAFGPWFDGVELLKSKNLSAVDTAAAKSKNVAIVGAGMSGLMTYLCLSQSGLTNISIIEASQRLGGRVHTVYLTGGPFDYSYQEMGPMRFPSTYTNSKTNETYNITDHQLVFQLAAEMNKLNNHDANLSVDFIPWYQSSENGLYYYNGIKKANGQTPTLAEISANSSLEVSTVLSASTAKLEDKIETLLDNEDFFVEMAQNMFKAHKEFLEDGLNGLPGDSWSEFAYMHNYLKYNLNDTDVAINDLGGEGSTSFWESLYDSMYFSAATYKTINGGLNRLPLSFHPLVDNVTTMNRKIERVQILEDTQQVQLQWRDNYTDTTFQSASYDYSIFALPFAIIKKWRLPSLPTTITNAINNMPFTPACKVALEFRTRFWEHTSAPIYGSCSTSTDIPGIGSICYPSYNINGSGPATMLASYISDGDWGSHWVSASDAEHVQYVLDAMIEIHGDVAREQYTGKYNRRCWLLDEYETGSWADPSIGQHELYLPEYFKTYNNMIFVGEQTSYTHAWIASALESGIRGSVQLLLELGLVDEAKAVAEKWMARWIEV